MLKNSICDYCDFRGYVTKNDLKCSDGRTIRKDAFKHQDGAKLPLVYAHVHDDPENVLGHILLENRDDGVYGYGFFNDTTRAETVKKLVAHGDLDAMSIWADELIQNGNNVTHGQLREVSLVLAGANPGAVIEDVFLAHADGSRNVASDEAIIKPGIMLDSQNEDHIEHSAIGGNKTINDVLATLNDEQTMAVQAVTTEILKQFGTIQHSNEGGETMSHNVFDGSANSQAVADKKVLIHDVFVKLNQLAIDNKASLRDTVIAHAADYGITNIGELFPDAKDLNMPPEFIKRDDDWVAGVLNGVKHSPFSRIRTRTADITHDEARAKGYIKGKLKKEEYFSVAKRETTPCTIYKKQKLDRDDILDVTGFDVVAWIRAEMRMMLEEEIARAILISDGRAIDDEDKISEEHLRPIYTENELYAIHYNIANGVNMADTDKLNRYSALLDNVIRARAKYKGSGNPKLYTAPSEIMEIMLLKDKLGRRLFANKSELASYIGVDAIVEIPQMDEHLKRTAKANENTGEFETAGSEYGLFGIIINLKDYTVGADKGGQITSFDDFDIDYNQFKYLLETRISGCLTKPSCAVVLETPVVTEDDDDEEEVAG